jgi:aspartate/tyrosine/aromatic aminotransferase
MTENEQDKSSILNELHHSIRCMYKEPPIHGSQVVEEIFQSPELKFEWESEVKMMHKRIFAMRQLLSKKLVECGSVQDWSHLTKQKGMFFYSGLSVKQCESLINDHSKNLKAFTRFFHLTTLSLGIYVVKNGRMAVPGINEHNVDYLALCLHNVTK